MIARYIMCGSRTWADRDTIHRKLLKAKMRHGASLEIYVGDEPNGADRLVHECCEELGIRHVVFCAAEPRYVADGLCSVIQVSSWRLSGPRAGPDRNRTMLYVAQGRLWTDTYGHADLRGVIAFRMPGVSRGTDNMCQLTRAAGVPVVVYSPDGESV